MNLPYIPDVFTDEEFVNRNAELSFLLGTAVPFRNDMITASKRVVHLIGKSGVGKSWLMQRFCNILSKEHSEYVLPLYINLQDYAGLTRDGFIVQLLKFIGNKIAFELNISFPFQNPDVQLEHSRWVFRGIEQVQKQKTFTLLLDEVSVLSDVQMNILEDYLLSPMLVFPKTLLVLSGRQITTAWKDFDLRPRRETNTMELIGFDFENTQTQIQTLNPQAEKLASKIYEISGGSPGKNKKILNQAGGNPLQIDKLNALRACNQELYDAIAVVGQSLTHEIGAELLPALEALCVLQDFDKEYEMPIILAAHKGLQGVWDVKRSASLLSILSGIQVGPGGLVDWDKGKSAYAIEEQIRLNLEQELKIRDKDLWATLHCTAMKLYAQWAKDYVSDIYVHKSEYHKSQLALAGFDPANC